MELLVAHMLYLVVLGCSFQKALAVIFTPRVNFMHLTFLSLFTVKLVHCKVFQDYHRKKQLLCSRSRFTCKEIMATGLENLQLSDSWFLVVLSKWTEWTGSGSNNELLFHVLLFPNILSGSSYTYYPWLYRPCLPKISFNEQEEMKNCL